MQCPEVVTAYATIALAVVGLSTLGAIIYVGVIQLKQLQRESHNRIIKNFLETWESDSMAESRRAFREAIRPKAAMKYEKQLEREAMNLKKSLERFRVANDPKFYAIVRIANYIETLGYMLKSKEDKQLIKDLMRDTILYYFSRFKPWIEQHRQHSPKIFRYFEELYLFCEESK